MLGKESGQFDRHEFQRKKESQISRTHFLWLVGILEIGGNVRIAPKWQDGKLMPAPCINVGMQPLQVDEFQAIFGGSISQISKGHHRLTLRGKPVVEIIQAIESDVVRLRSWTEKSLEMYERFIDGEEFDLQAIKEANEFDKEKLVSEDYLELIEQAAVVAGIIDNRGGIYNSAIPNTLNRNNPILQVNSTNKVLLDALAIRYGGSVQHYVEEGDQFTVMGKEAQANRDSFYWRLNSGGVRKFLPLWEGYLVRKPYAGWDSSVLKDRMSSNTEIAKDINQQMAAEIQAIEDEGSLSISTVEDLMQQHGLSVVQWPNFKERYLDTQLYQRHAELRNRLLQRKTTEEEIISVVDFITYLFDRWKSDSTTILPAKRQWRKYFRENLGIDLSENDTQLVRQQLGDEFYGLYSKVQQQQAQVIASRSRESLLSQSQIESMQNKKKIAEEVDAFLASEIESFHKGEIQCFSSVEEVAERFGITLSSWHYFKVTYLNGETVAQHSKLRNVYNQKKKS